MAIYIQYMFHEIQFIGYLVIAEDGKTDRRMEGRVDGQCQTNIPTPLAGD